MLVTMDGHLASAAARAEATLAAALPGLRLDVHAASQWAGDGEALARCLEDIGRADVLIVTMLFMEEHFLPVLPALQARRASCDVIVCAMCATEVTRLTRMGRFTMDGGGGSLVGWLKRLRGKGAGQPNEQGVKAGAGAQQMAMLRRLPRLLRFVPGTAQDLRAYFLVLQYWLSGSEANVVGLVHLLVDRYADGPRAVLRGRAPVPPPQEYPEVGLYHPRATPRLTTRPEQLPRPAGPVRGTVGLVLMRSYLLAGNTDHYDGVIEALEAEGLAVRAVFATGLDARPAIEAFLLDADGRPIVDALVSLTGFSLVGGPAYHDASAAAETLSRLDVPYLSALPVEFQSLAQWQDSERGLLPVEATMMVALPELDGATGGFVFGGRDDAGHDLRREPQRAQALAARVARWVALRRSARAQRRVAVVLFNFPPNAGAVGTAAFLSVFESLFNTLAAMRDAGYTVELPADADALRRRLLEGNAARNGTPANVFARVGADDIVRREPHLREIEAQWGPAPGKPGSDGRSVMVLGERFGNVFVGLQPAFGWEGDPMRLLFERGFAPTHAFSTFYRWLREDFAAHALLHFGTHGALEFMPGKQVGLSGACWPERLIGDLPHLYLYASNNPSEGTLAKRRAGATLISHLTPAVTQAGLYRGLADLKALLDRHRALPPQAGAEAEDLARVIDEQAAALPLAARGVAAVHAALLELETTLIPHGLHVVGRPPDAAQRAEILQAMADGGTPAEDLARVERLLGQDHELPALLHALDGGFVRPAPGGDLLRTPDVLPTGRNLHGFDPFRLPSAYAVRDGERQAERLLARHRADGHPLPETIAIVLWGTDNLKTEGSAIAQVLALIGARPRFDSYGRLAGAQLRPLEELGRPRIDVVVTLSGIFRDLLPLQIKLLAEAAFLAASADEPLALNAVRRHALAYQAAHGGDLETAALRVFGNAEGAYGANVNALVDSSRWDDGDEIAETYTRRKGYAYGRGGRATRQPQLLGSVLADVQLAYQNLDSVELGITTVDTYFDTLGGISRAVQRAQGGQAAPVYIGDQTRGGADGGTVRTLDEQVALETRTRMLNPKWVEGLLDHGYEGVRQIEQHLTNTLGWSATTGQVQPWVYQQISETFVLDPAMRERLAALNPTASARVANRLLEAHERRFWSPDAQVLEALRRAGEELEDRLEGIFIEKAAA
ncbi:protoporphyrin IX Mg-chelatase, subunit H [Piscinibacter sakaiensis]|uniref:magnesium chelatase n=1 Tax=Piscinibacter sakaiensis TaxID=1547922 RepID=A0A0K8NVG4_PISS1|nr:protoporphyrin IX Mg-chelatase, subunit H [Piscinibacter sakaiensis]